MKELLLQLSAYNIWANTLLTDLIQQLPEEQLAAQVPSSFTTLPDTLLHLWNAESVWWQRLKLQERIVPPADNFSGGIKEICNGLLQQNRQWNEWIANATEHMFAHEFIYSNSKKEKFKQPTFQMLLHVFNHGTYHRGQLVNMLRQLGIEKIPSTDFIIWSRKK